MADNVKVIIAEKNGVELDFHEEYTLTAENIPFDPTGTDFTATDVQGAIEESFAPPIETLTEFESFSSQVQETTTSNSPITKSGYPYTTTVKSAGKYCIDYSTQIGQGSNNRISQFIVQFREGTSGTWTDLLNTQQELRDLGFVPWSGFSIIEITSPTVFQIRIQYANPGSGSCIIKESNIKVGKVST